MTVTLLHGIRIRSPFPLGPEAEGAGPADIEILAVECSAVPVRHPPGEVIAHRDVPGGPLFTATSTSAGDSYILRLHGLCDFVIDARTWQVSCMAMPDTAPELLGIVVRGTLLAFYLGVTGSCAMHSAAVEVDGTAMLLVGDSGMGKSTLAALGCQAGARLVADDLVRLELGDGVQWVGSGHELRLRPRSAELLGHLEAAWDGRMSFDGRLTLRPQITELRRGRVKAVVVPLLSRDVRRLELTYLDPVDATLLLSAFPRLDGWRLRAAAEAQFASVAALAQSVPVVVATLPWGVDGAEHLVSELFERFGMAPTALGRVDRVGAGPS